MLLKELIKNVDSKFADLEIKGVTYNARKVENGFAFVCVSGPTHDGHEDAALAAENGTLAGELLRMEPFTELLVPMIVVFAGAGMFVGLVGSFTSIRKYMNV